MPGTFYVEEKEKKRREEKKEEGGKIHVVSLRD